MALPCIATIIQSQYFRGRCSIRLKAQVAFPTPTRSCQRPRSATSRLPDFTLHMGSLPAVCAGSAQSASTMSAKSTELFKTLEQGSVLESSRTNMMFMTKMHCSSTADPKLACNVRGDILSLESLHGACTSILARRPRAPLDAVLVRLANISASEISCIAVAEEAVVWRSTLQDLVRGDQWEHTTFPNGWPGHACHKGAARPAQVLVSSPALVNY